MSLRRIKALRGTRAQAPAGEAPEARGVRKAPAPNPNPNRSQRRDGDLLRWMEGRNFPLLGGAPAVHPMVWPKHTIMVTASTSKWLIIALQPMNRVIDQKVIVFAMQGWASFALLQSATHIAWARYSGLCSTMSNTYRYTPSKSFATWAWPRPLDHAGPLAALGSEVAYRRGILQLKHKLGLTQLYNCMASRTERDPEILDLRAAHQRMDQGVFDAYGWTDLVAPDWTDLPAEGRPDLPVVDEVIRRLRNLNRQRAAEERARGAS